MSHRKPVTEVTCAICGQHKPITEVMPAEVIRDSLSALIRESHPDWSAGSFICAKDLNAYRDRYVQRALASESGELSALEEEVARSLRDHELLAANVNQEFLGNLTLGDRLADRVARFGGSWTFILCFGFVMALWMTINSSLLLTRPFDPFPFILLNLVLSCLAAIQAPIIMMSQNRQEAKDRLRAENDYQTNLKAELEIRHLNQKMDQLLKHQWRRLLEIQQIQTDLMEELAGRKPGGTGAA